MFMLNLAKFEIISIFFAYECTLSLLLSAKYITDKIKLINKFNKFTF
jgi:hypothetical protein